MANDRCEVFQALVRASKTELELTDDQRDHLADCHECEGIYMEDCVRWWTARDIAKMPEIKDLESRVLTEGASALERVGLPSALLPAVVRCAKRRASIN